MGNSLSVTVITAAAGYGKTTFADRLVSGARWYRAGDAAALIRGGWPDPCPPALVLDDPVVPPAELGAWLERAADALPARLVVLTRHPVPVAGLRASGRIAELGAAELALTPAQVRTVLDEHGIADPWLAAGVREATAGWPMLVRLAGEALAGDRGAPGRLAETLALPGKPVARYLAVEVLAELSPVNRRAVRILSRLELITEDLCRRIGEPAPLDELAALGVLLSTSDGAYRMVPVLAAVAARTLPLSDVDIVAAAASWYAGHGQPGSAARAYLGAGDCAAAARVLEDHGAAVLAAEGADAVLGLVTRIPPERRSRALTLLHAEALGAGR
jgi:ATP/maltotriose-dependent transcriptional regulator MalT